MTQQLKGKVALVTGGSRGIGAAIAKRLAADGAHVAFSYAKSPEQARNVVADIERQGVQALAIQADQGDTAQVIALVKQVHQHFGRLDILVNSAGVQERAFARHQSQHHYLTIQTIRLRGVSDESQVLPEHFVS